MSLPARPMAEAAPVTFGAAVAVAQARLEAAGVDSPRRDARLLVALAAGLDAATVLGYPERPLAPAASLRLARLVERRAAREPVARLAGRREFWSRDFALSPATLDPRPDSETLVAAALERLPDRQAAVRILDLGTGTGCLLLALLGELPKATGFGIDVVPEAVAVARANAVSIGLELRAFFAVSAWGAALAGAFDVVVANPPYIPTGDLGGLPAEVARYDPALALDGGPDGLLAYRELAPQLRRLLRPSGFACIEVGAGQAKEAAAIFAAAGLDEVGRHCDLAGTERCVVVKPRPRNRRGSTAKKLLE